MCVIIIMFDKFETEIDALNVFNVAMTALIVAIIGVSQNCGGQPICDPDILVHYSTTKRSFVNKCSIGTHLPRKITI